MNNKIVSNSAWIIGVKLVQATIGLVITMLTARYLGPSNYGLINYAMSLAAFFTPVMRLGLNGILVQEIVNKPDEEGKTAGTAIVMTAVSGMLCIIGILSFTMIVNAGETETIIVCALYSISMLLEALHIVEYWFQAKLLSKYTSLSMLGAYVVVSVYRVFLLINGKSVYWFALSYAIEIAVIDVALLILYYQCGGQRLCFSWETSRRVISRSKYYILAEMMVVLYAQTDRIMLKLILDDAAIGYYSAAVSCVGMTSFVFSAIIDSMRPSILESRKRNKKNYEKGMITLYMVIIYLSLVQCIVITLLAPVMVGILYGVEYSPSVNALRIIVWYTTFSYLGAVRNVWILAENKHHLLWRVNMSGALANVVLNFILIPIWGVNGAALASLITQIVTNMVLCFVIKELRPTLGLMMNGLDARHLYATIKLVLHK